MLVDDKINLEDWKVKQYTLMTGTKGTVNFVSRESRNKIKCFPRDQSLSDLLHSWTF